MIMFERRASEMDGRCSLGEEERRRTRTYTGRFPMQMRTLSYIWTSTLAVHHLLTLLTFTTTSIRLLGGKNTCLKALSAVHPHLTIHLSLHCAQIVECCGWTPLLPPLSTLGTAPNLTDPKQSRHCSILLEGSVCLAPAAIWLAPIASGDLVSRQKQTRQVQCKRSFY